MASPENYNYLCFTYDPAIANDLGTAFTDELLTNFTGKNEVYYAIQWDPQKNDFVLNEDGVVETLKRFAWPLSISRSWHWSLRSAMGS